VAKSPSPFEVRSPVTRPLRRCLFDDPHRARGLSGRGPRHLLEQICDPPCSRRPHRSGLIVDVDLLERGRIDIGDLLLVVLDPAVALVSIRRVVERHAGGPMSRTGRSAMGRWLLDHGTTASHRRCRPSHRAPSVLPPRATAMGQLGLKVLTAPSFCTEPIRACGDSGPVQAKSRFLPVEVQSCLRRSCA